MTLTTPPQPTEDGCGARNRPQWMLHLQAQVWRVLMSIGMLLHKLAPPRPPKPAFVRQILTTVAEKKGFMKLHFYVPKKWKDTRKNPGEHKFPVLINFHGGGFTLGKATDDARWSRTVVDEVGAIVISVDYRLAPEHPFPTAVEDGVDAILWIVKNADDYDIDIDKIAISGFSSGANMCFTVPLRLQEELLDETTGGDLHRPSVVLYQRPPLQKAFSEGRMLVATQREIKIKAIVAWYPPTDYTHTRAQRRATATRVDQQLPAIFTDLFDESYLQPPTLDMTNPYLSPGVAPHHMLAGLPQEIIMFTCEWDMLVVEAEQFRDRLVDELGKTVHYHMVQGAPHGWDKAPNPLRQTPGVQEQYLKACKELKRLLNS